MDFGTAMATATFQWDDWWARESARINGRRLYSYVVVSQQRVVHYCENTFSNKLHMVKWVNLNVEVKRM